jgi:hypothetical protein
MRISQAREYCIVLCVRPLLAYVTLWSHLVQVQGGIVEDLVVSIS